MPSYTNKLASETSPYLLQHAHNPVDWYPWGEEAFERAKQEDKPVLVSIGYAACHWCHVMERESFENPDIASIMNRHFINIKVDREERPDIDHIYMDAVQAISGSGGWPLNVFLTPDKKPFYGGTYFPPKRAFNRASWSEVLLALSNAYQEKKEEISQQAENLTQHLETSNAFGNAVNGKEVFSEDNISQALGQILQTADREWGGFGRAPKFPQTFTITFLLRYYHIHQDQEALDQALLTLDKMVQGGIYDQVGGGFARYSTDTEWLAPHFEKMLYDNALLVTTLVEAYQLTGNESYRRVVEETLAFVERELMHPEGGFYSALDADSEGVEGKFYVWTLDEVQEVLGTDAPIFCSYYDITKAGNWEGYNIPRILKPAAEVAGAWNMQLADFEAKMEECKRKLLEKRAERVRPALDDKVLLGWNALMNMAFCRAGAALGKAHYKEVAVRNMEFLLKSFRSEVGSYCHAWKNGVARHPAFLEDYSYLVAALIELVQVTADYEYLGQAEAFTNLVLDHFFDPGGSPLFLFTHEEQRDVLFRKKEIYDGATPSGNAVVAYNLYRLSILINKAEWRERAEDMIRSLGEVIFKYPTSFGHWLCLVFEIFSGTKEVAVIGEEWKIYLEKILGIYISHKLALATENPLPEYPLVAHKAKTSKIQIYLCENYTCRTPVNTIQDFVTLLYRK